MSENEGTTPETPAAAAAPQQPSATPTTPAPAAGPVPPVPPMPSTPAQHAVPAVPAAVAPYRPAAPAPQGYHPTAPTRPYPAPVAQGPMGPQGPIGPQGYPSGAAFGPAAGPTTQAPKKKSSAGRIVGLLVAAAVIGGAAGLGGTYAGFSLWGGGDSPSAAGPAVVTVNDTSSVNATTAVAAKVLPSVVTISASAGSSGGTGSGVILSDDGYVLTNTHVVTLDGQAGNATITVTTSDGKVYQADVVGTDPTYDLAVVKLKNASGLTPIEWGDSANLNVGDVAIAVGAPLGLSNTVTTGIVSALNRSIEIASSAAPDQSSQDQQGQGQGQQDQPFFFDFGQGQSQGQTTSTIKIAVIQTDAAINPGNSGGALVDAKGNLIGINVAIASAGSSSSGTAGNIGVGFAIPSNVAQRVSQEIIDNGTATHGLLGANVQPATSIEGATTTGAYLKDVTAGGAAAAAGLQAGDVVTEFNGVPVTDAIDLTAQVRAAAAGSTATVTYVRDGQSHTATVTLGSLQ
jgi:putative serine protease PepD